ncbi:MAG: Gfo/Idh/MocA family oxidoreductase [Verrucomicrobiota bacterium]|jgi:predicted dehydrogenase|nr:Gfo/Idh/MocA family oxidoreductase [Verrucomicrobiota bacterium]
MTQPLRWGILGTGMIAAKFAADLKQASRSCMEAIGSRRQEDAEAFAAIHGGRGIAGYEALINDPEVQAVYISLPNGLHAEWSIKAMEAGKHVLCEKPMARNAAEAEAMFTAAERTGQLLVEAFMYRTLPSIRKLIEMVRDGALGQVKLIRSNFSFTRDVLEGDARYEPSQAGGGLMDVGCYCVNLTRAIMGSEPTDTACFAHLHERGVDDYAAGVLRFGDKTLATFTCGMTVANDWTTYIAGDDGEIAIHDPWLGDGTFTLTRDGQAETIEAKTDIPLYALEAEAFAKTVGGAKPWITRDDTLGNMRVLDRLREQAGVPVPA